MLLYTYQAIGFPARRLAKLNSIGSSYLCQAFSQDCPSSYWTPSVPNSVTWNNCEQHAQDHHHIKAVGKTKEGRKRLIEKASKISIVGNAELPWLEGVGWVERRRQHDGSVITSVYPKVLYRKARRRIEGIDWKELSKRNYGDNEEEIGPNPFAGCRLGDGLAAKELSKGLRRYTEECVAGPQYYFQNGFRKVKPYYHVFDTLVRVKRNEQKTLRDELRRILPFYHMDWIKFKLRRCQLLVNFCPAHLDQNLKFGDLLTTLQHQHEHPVVDWPIDVIYEDKNLLVVNKPPSYLIYPMSGYRHNSLTFVLRRELGSERAGDLRPLHRLDKYTSGVMCFAKGAQASRNAKYFLSNGKVRKEYLALVDGIFPPGETVCSQPLSSFENIKHSEKFYSTGPKESVTIFERLEADQQKNVSLVRCIPLTGRTHQIRLHLRCLGHYIVNDCLYNPQDRKVIMSFLDEKLQQEALERIEARVTLKDAKGHSKSCSTSWQSEEEWLSSLSATHAHCDECLVCEMGEGAFEEVEAAAADCSFMCLHASKYKLDDNLPEFVASRPRWLEDPTLLEGVFARRKHSKASGV